MKAANFKKMAAVTIIALFTMGLTSCHSTKVIKKTEVERSTVLTDQSKPLTDWINCATCNGKGTCSNCNGKGKIKERTCLACNGTGKCNVCGGEGGHRAE